MKYFLTLLPLSLYASESTNTLFMFTTLISLSFALIISFTLRYKKLIRSEEYYKKLYELTPNPLMIVNSKDVIVDVNGAFESIVGIKKKLLVGKTWYERLISSEKALIIRHQLFKLNESESITMPLIDSVGMSREFDFRITELKGLDKKRIFTAYDTCSIKNLINEVGALQENLSLKTEALAQQSEQIELTFDMAINGIAILDGDGSLKYSNTSLQEMLDYNESYFKHVGLEVIFGDEESAQSLLTVAKAEERIEKMHHIIKNRSGKEIDITISMAYLDTLDQYFLVIQDVSKEVKYTKFLEDERDVYEERSFRDGLMGIFNRAYLNHTLSAFVEDKKNFSLILFDVDHFKAVNDNFGHIVGDKVLIAIATTVKENLRSGDIFARFGGEEFVILIPRGSLVEAVTTSEKLRIKIEEIYHPHGERVTCSFGVAQYQAGMRMSDIINESDEALYEAKSSGRNCVKTKSDLK